MKCQGSFQRRALTVAVLSLAALSLTGCPESPKSDSEPVTVAVQFDFDDKIEKLQRPVADVEIEVWTYGRRGVNYAWTKDATGTTNTQGRYETKLPFTAQDVIYAVRVIPHNGSAACCAGFAPPGLVPPQKFWFEPGEDVKGGRPIHLKANSPGDTVTFTHLFTDQWGSIFNAMDVIRHAAMFVKAHHQDKDSDRIEEARIGLAGSGPADASWFDPVAYTMNLTPGDRWQDDTVLHEYGHYLQAQISTFAWIASSHEGCTPGRFVVFGGNGNILTDYSNGNAVPAKERVQHAWMEGFADWLAEVIYADNPSLYGPKSHAGQYLESASCSAAGPWPDGDRFEWHVAAFLWDLTDAASTTEPNDKDSGMGQIETILTAFDNEIDGGGWPSVAKLSYALAFDSKYGGSSDNAVANKVWWPIVN